MRLLITTQIVDRDDAILGFFHEWINEIAQRCESVTVICLKEGAYDLPRNVSVHSLGKERGAVSRFTYAWRFFSKLYSLRRSYDAVLVHMNPEYVVLAGLYWRLTGRRVGLWYVHKHVSIMLRIATRFASVVFTASRESFRLRTRKLVVTGHGIPAAFFTVRGSTDFPMAAVTTGRISRTKRLDLMIDALVECGRRGIHLTLDIVGVPVTSSEITYAAELRKLIECGKYPNVRLIEPVPNASVPSLLRSYGLFINLSSTGSMDKAVLEAMASDVIPISSNEAFRAILQPRGLFVDSDTPQAIADTIEHLLARSVEQRQEMRTSFREYVEREHSLISLVPRILQGLS